MPETGRRLPAVLSSPPAADVGRLGFYLAPKVEEEEMEA
jgi:hypothetical protein